MKKLTILLTIAALVWLTFTAMAAGDGIAFDASAPLYGTFPRTVRRMAYAYISLSLRRC